MTQRKSLLDEAASLVDGDRNVQYGDPREDFARTAAYWNTHLKGVAIRRMYDRGWDTDNEWAEDFLAFVESMLSSYDVAIMMMMLKMSRLSWSPDKKDHWVDVAGYAACGFDCAVPNAHG